MPPKRKQYVEEDARDERLRMMQDIAARMQVAMDNGEYDKVPGLEREFDDAKRR
jgi:hypothetical protein